MMLDWHHWGSILRGSISFGPGYGARAYLKKKRERKEGGNYSKYSGFLFSDCYA